MEGEDFFDVTETYVVVMKDGKTIAEGRIHYEVFENIWEEEMEMHDRQGQDNALIIKGKRYQSAELSEEDGYEIEWGDERELETFKTYDEADSAFENYVKYMIDHKSKG
tara:strand:+ start:75 stop:401 length:327 start_codon:yes stop_codon:yes gene_type:complete